MKMKITIYYNSLNFLFVVYFDLNLFSCLSKLLKQNQQVDSKEGIFNIIRIKKKLTHASKGKLTH